ncbi:hypothetical protein FACS1894211_04130 [Clostridia bacterium]|nr:hypothetical protein FACS1894211_04130 [Clostridia bacterium]
MIRIFPPEVKHHAKKVGLIWTGTVTEKARVHYALDSFMLSYGGVSGNRDNIKVEINYLDRCHILPLEYRTLTPKVAGREFSVLALNPIELYASKTTALLSRCAPRDLYDVYTMITGGVIADENLFRKCFVFYNAVGGNQDADNLNFDIIDTVTYDKVKRQLKPVISKTDTFDVKNAQAVVREYLKSVLTLTESEIEFIRLFKTGDCRLDFLFEDKAMAERIAMHPMLIWRQNSIRKG